MAELSLICLTLYAVTSLIVGTRLIARSWRSRGLPEFLIGCTYAVASGSGYPLSVVAPYLSGRSATLAAMIVAQVLIAELLERIHRFEIADDLAEFGRVVIADRSVQRRRPDRDGLEL